MLILVFIKESRWFNQITNTVKVGLVGNFCLYREYKVIVEYSSILSCETEKI